MFSSGDCRYWLMVEKEELIGVDGNKYYVLNEDRTILRSSESTKSTVAKWLRREGVLMDPWVSIYDHIWSQGGSILYGGGAHPHTIFAVFNTWFIQNRKGADVFIRQSMFNIFR